MRLEGTLSGSVLSVVLCRHHEDSKRNHNACFLSLCSILSLFGYSAHSSPRRCLYCFHMTDPVRVVFQQLQSPDRGRVRESHCKLTLTEQAAQWYEAQSVVSDISSLFSERKSLLRVSRDGNFVELLLPEHTFSLVSLYLLVRYCS